MRRRPRLLGLALVVSLAGAFAWREAPGILERRLEKELTTLFGRTSHVGSVELGLLPLQAEVKDVTVDGSTSDRPPFLEIRRATVVPAFRRVFEERRITLWRLVVESPTVRIRTFPQGGDDLPSLRTGQGGGTEIDIRRLVVEEGQVILDEQKVPFRLDLPGLRGRLTTPPGGGLAGQVALGPGPVRFGSAPPMPVDAELDLVLKGNTLRVNSAHLRAPATDVRATGEVQLKPLTAYLAVSGPVDLALADSHVLRTALRLGGRGEYHGTAELAKGRLSFTGRLSGQDGRFDGHDVPSFQGQVSWGPGGTRLRDFELEAMGGRARLDVDVAPAPGAVRVKGELRGVDVETLARYVFDLGALHVAGSVKGPLDVTWPRGARGRVGGAADLALEARTDGTRTPLSGRVRWTAAEGRQRVEELVLHTPHTDAVVTGTVGRDREADLALSVESHDLDAADRLGARLRRAVGAQRFEPAEIAGSGRFTGQWRGTLDAPDVSGRLVARGFRYLGVDWGELDWTGRSTPDTLATQSAVVRRGHGTLHLSGQRLVGRTPADDRLDMTVRFERWPAVDFRTALASDVALAGELSGETRFTGTALEPWGTARVQGDSGTWAGIPYEGLEVVSDLRGPELHVTSGRARVGGGDVSFRGRVGALHDYDGSGEASGVALETLAAVFAPGQPWGGRVSARGTLQGTLAAPRLHATVESPRIFFGDEGVGALQATLDGRGDGLVDVDSHVSSARVDVTVSGRAAATPPYVADLRIAARDTSLDPFARVLAPALPDAVGFVMSGSGTLQGPLRDVSALKAAIDVERLVLLFPGYPVSNRQPFGLDLADGRVTLETVRLAGEGTDLEARGSVGLRPGDAADLHFAGAADLRALAAVVPGVRGRGAARLQMDVTGPPATPVIAGEVELEGAGLRVRGFPHGLDDLHGRIRFSERNAQFADVTGRVGGGEVELAGTASYTPEGLQSFDVRSSGRGLSLRYPEGLKSLVDAELRFFGDAERRWATGSVDVRQAEWTRRYDVASELLAARGLQGPAASASEGALLDVRVRAPGTLKVENNLASLQARAELSVRGTSDAPVLLGRAEVERGRVYFQGTTYVIRRGTIDFANPQQTDPVFDLEAEARVRSYRVTLDVDGTLDRVYPVLSSDPPLSPVQIVSLLAGADEETVSSLTQGTLATTGDAPGARLAAAGAATLAAGRLSEEVGLERGAERLFGLNRFSIDPSLVRGGVQNPTARLTMGKRITPDLNVLYSVDLRGTEERLLAVEYTVSDRLSLLLTRAEPGGFGFDLRLRQSR